MKFTTIAVVATFAASTSAFAPSRNSARISIGRGGLSMAMATPPPAAESSIEMPVIQSRGGAPVDVRYSDFLRLVNGDRIEKVTFSADGTQLLGVDTDGTRLKLEALPNDPDLLTQLTSHKVDVTVLPANEAAGGLGDLAQSLILPAALFAGLFFLSRRAGGGAGMGGMGGPGNPMAMGKSKAQIQMIPDTGVNFDDVAGCDGAKIELVEIVDFLKQPESYSKNGCRIPRGVILDGPPGTGKTLLAKAVAGEAGVPFISISGSEFVEMFVGVGASRVRDVFSQAKKNAPCIIFIDEIDAVGRQRGAGFAGGNDEREQTINQILVEMDGFDGNPGIITIAATNRVDILDQALLRPGRFDRKITVDLPDFKGRTRILGVHARGKPLEPDVDLEAIGRRTPGFSGAQLENLMNEAAITAARRSKSTIGWEEIDGAVDRIMVGLEKNGGTAMISMRQNELVAYHEAGHAICGALIPDYDQVQKISIIPRSNGAGGLTFFSPQEQRLESGMYSKQYLESQLAVALGGRLAEELVYGEDLVTTGASNDIMQVANIAKRMVKEWGMSDVVGRIALSSGGGARPFMGRSMGQRQTQWGGKIMSNVDSEVERLVNNSYLTAKNILSQNRDLLDHLARTLVEQEVVSAEEFQMMLVEFNAKVVPFEIVGKEKNRDKLPFQNMPAAVMNLSRVMSTASRRVATVSVVGRSSSVVVANISQRGFVVATATQLLRNPEEDVAGSSRLGGLIATAAAAMGASIALANNERADCCGIAGVVGGSGDAREFLLEGLTILKNRGYDSAGIATIGDPKDGLTVTKFASVGENADGVELVRQRSMASKGHQVGIAHTRWATHGGKTDENAHPHLDTSGRVALVHNGTINNANDLRRDLQTRGHVFLGQTDTEVIAKLIGEIYEKDGGSLKDATEKALSRCDGTWGLGIMCTDAPDELVVACNGSPLVIGIGTDRMFIASETSAFNRYTKNFISMKDGEIGVLHADGTTLDLGRMQVAPDQEVLLSPAPYSHWTLKEMYEQPEAIGRSLGFGGRLMADKITLGGLEMKADKLAKVDFLTLCACGTSLNASRYAEKLMKHIGSFDVVHSIDAAEIETTDFPQNPAAAARSAFLVVSQSGETKDVARVVQAAQEKDVTVMSVVNAVGSLIARMTKLGVYCNAGRENAVASTKAFTTQVTVLALIALWFRELKDRMSGSEVASQEGCNLREALMRLPICFGMALKTRDQCKKIAERLNGKDHCFVLGKGYGEPVAMEGALKIKEMCYLHAEGYSGGALKHGPFALIESDENGKNGATPIIMLIFDDDHAHHMRTAAEEVKARGADVIIITDKRSLAEGLDDDPLVIPSNGPLTALGAVLPIQLMAFELAIMRGINPDTPRNLAKAVTVD